MRSVLPIAQYLPSTAFNTFRSILTITHILCSIKCDNLLKMRWAIHPTDSAWYGCVMLFACAFNKIENCVAFFVCSKQMPWYNTHSYPNIWKSFGKCELIHTNHVFLQPIQKVERQFLLVSTCFAGWVACHLHFFSRSCF